MFRDTSETGGTTRKHAWIVSAIVDLAAYAEQNGLKHLNQQLCHALATAMLGELAEQDCGSPGSPLASQPDNVVHLDLFARRHS
jgi:hypothetical protein